MKRKSPTLVMFPFMASAPPVPIGGWRFVRWENAVKDRVPASLQPRYLRWSRKLPWSRPGWGSPCAAIPEDHTTLPLADVVHVMMYCHLSSRSKLGCTRASFTYREVQAVQPNFRPFRQIPEVRATPFHATGWSESLLMALSGTFSKAPSLGPSELLPRVRRAIVLHNEAYWLWETDRPISTVFFVLTLALAFEALFTPPRSRRLEHPGDLCHLRSGPLRELHAGRSPHPDRMRQAILEYIGTTSFCDELVAELSPALCARPGESIDGFAARLRDVLDAHLCGASGISATILQNMKVLLLEGRQEEYFWRGLTEWWKGFYGLRSRIAHGGSLDEGDFLRLGEKKEGRHHAMVARRMFSAVIYALLRSQGLCAAEPGGRDLERYVKPALDEMIPNGVRFDIVSEMVGRGDYLQHEHQTELRDLLDGIQDWDASFSVDQASRVTKALDGLKEQGTRLPKFISWAVPAVLQKVKRLQTYAEYMRTRPPSTVL